MDSRNLTLLTDLYELTMMTPLYLMLFTAAIPATAVMRLQQVWNRSLTM